MKKPWQKISSKVAHRNPWWQLRVDQVIQPDGKRGVYYVADMNNFVSIIALSDDGKKVHLIRQWRYPIDRNSWETSQGLVEKGESPLKAAKRELREELGFKARRWQKLGFNYLANGFANQGFYIFLARDLEYTQKDLEGTESDMISRCFSLNEARKMILEGKILDSPTIVSFYYLDNFLKK